MDLSTTKFLWRKDQPRTQKVNDNDECNNNGARRKRRRMIGNF